jgi:hypothetical protein
VHHQAGFCHQTERAVERQTFPRRERVARDAIGESCRIIGGWCFAAFKGGDNTAEPVDRRAGHAAPRRCRSSADAASAA